MYIIKTDDFLNLQWIFLNRIYLSEYLISEYFYLLIWENQILIKNIFEYAEDIIFFSNILYPEISYRTK